MTSPPAIANVLETCLYVKDIKASTEFYSAKLRLTPLFSTERMAVFPFGVTTLIIFALGQTGTDSTSERGIVPTHGPTEELLQILGERQLKQHYCLAVEKVEVVKEWEAWFEKEEVKTLGVMNWEKGGRSVYFEDPDGHVGEIGSRGIWTHY